MTLPKPTTPLGELVLTGAQAATYRRSRGRLQIELAKAMGYAQASVSGLERSPELKPGSIAALAAGYGMTPQEYVRAAIRAAEADEKKNGAKQ